MGLTTEIVIFETSDAFRDDPVRMAPTVAFDAALKSAGVHAPAYYGCRIENPSTGYFFLNWDSLEAHQAVADSPAFPVIIEALKPTTKAGSKSEMYHVQFSAPTVAFDQPVTQVLVLTLKSPENRAAVFELLTRSSEASGKMLVFGQTLEDENKIILVGGWPSVEAHQETIARPVVAEALEKLYSLANKDHLYHTKLSRYPL